MSARKIQYARKDISRKKLMQRIEESRAQDVHWRFMRSLKRDELKAFTTAAHEAGLAAIVETSGLPEGTFACPALTVHSPVVDIYYARETPVQTIMANGFSSAHAQKNRYNGEFLTATPLSTRRSSFKVRLRTNSFDDCQQYALLKELFEGL